MGWATELIPTWMRMCIESRVPGGRLMPQGVALAGKVRGYPVSQACHRSGLCHVFRGTPAASRAPG